MKRYLIAILFFLISFTYGYGQKISYFGKISDKESSSGLSGVTVSVIVDGGSSAATTTTASDGKYSLQFDPGRNYTIKYSKSGYVSKIIKIETEKVNAEDMPPGGKIFPDVDLDLFKKIEGVDFSYLKTEPVVTWYFDRAAMNFDRMQVSRMKKKIQQTLEEAGDLAEQQEAEYNALIQEADQLFKDEKYKGALDKYGTALKIPGKQKEEYPSQQIVKIGDLLQGQEEQELAAEQGNQEYSNFITAADNLAKEKKYDKAIDTYNEALKIKPDEQYPKDKITELQDTKANASKQDEFDKIIKSADGFFKQNSLRAARDKYQKALKLLPNEDYPQQQLDKIKGQLDAKSEQIEKHKKYNDAIAAADDFFDKEQYEEAIDKYKEAISYEDASTYPPQRIKLAEEKLAEQKAQKEKEEQFKQLVVDGDKQVNLEKYEGAIDKYNQALALIDDEAITKKRDETQELLNKQKENEDQVNQIVSLLASGQEKLDSENFQGAIDDFTDVLGLDDENSDAIEGKKKAEELLSSQQDKEAQKDQFNQLVAEGDKQVDSENYENAIDKYNQALAIIEDDAITKKRDETQELLSAQKENKEQANEIAGLLESGQKKLDSEDYQEAIDDFTSVLGLDDENAKAIEGKKNAEKSLTELQDQEAQKDQFDQLVADGDKQVRKEDYEGAIEKYNQALELIKDDDVTKKRDETQELLNEKQENKEQANQIATLLESGQKKMDSEDYQGAIDDYTSVLELDDQNPDAIKGKKDAEELLANQADKEAQKDQFDQLVVAADTDFDAEKWEDAKSKYIAAKGIFDKKDHVNNRIDEIRKILQKQEGREDLAEEIQVLLDQAEQLKQDNSWDKVIQKYEEAIKLDDQRDDVSALLEDAKKSKKEWDAQQSENAQFDQLKQDGEALMAKKEWSDAKSKFEDALKIKDDKEIEKNIEIIEKKIAEAQQSKGEDKAYSDKMDEAEKYVSTQDYENAITSFKEALKIKEDDATAKSRIKDMQQKIDLQEASEEKEERYASAMKDAQKAFDDKDYAAAIKLYDDALIEKPLDAAATKLKKEAKIKISNLQSEEEVYQGLLSDAQKKYDDGLANNNDIPTLKEAKEKYVDAQKMRPKASLPQNRIVEIDQLIRKIEEDKGENKEEEKEYQDKLDLASVAAQNSKYQNAIDYLKEASKIKPDEDLPKQKIKEYQALLDQIASKEELEKNYTKKIGKADLAFDNKNYEESINLYNEALEIKKDEDYPKSQIRKAEKAMKEQKTNSVDEEYNKYISEADKYFSDEDYKAAIISYKSALEIKSDDDYAKQKINKAQQELKQQMKQAAINAAQSKEFNKHIKIADSLFENEDYLGAKEEYENGLRINPNDVYANEQVNLCVHKAEEKTRTGDEERYQKILTVADKNFDEENYDKASDLYKRAIGFRSTDQYPKDKLAEIDDIRNGDAKLKNNIEDLGEQSDISILEGAALLEEGAKQRERKKVDAIEDQLKKYEGNAKVRSDKDYEERVKYQNEVVAIKDLRGENKVDQQEQHRVFIDHVNDIEYDWEKKGTELSNYERGENNQTYRNVVYIDDAMDNVKREKKDNHDEIIEKIKIVKKDRDNQSNAESARNKANIESTSDKLLNIERKNEKLTAVNNEKQEDLQVKVDDIIKGREVQTHKEGNDNYARVMQLQSDATLAEIKDAESKEGKMAVNKQLQEDMKVLAASLQRKEAEQSNEVYQAQLEVESQLSRAKDNYEATKTKKDEDRQQIVENVKDLKQDQLKQANKRSKEYYQTTQDNLEEVNKVENMQDEQAVKNKKDLEAIDKGVKAQVEEIERTNTIRKQQEKNEHHQAMDKVERIEKQYELTTKGKNKDIERNYEGVKGLKASVDGNEQERQKLSKDKKMEIQKLVNQLENNSITYSVKIANTIGDKYPEGVSQENYIRKDKDGIPVKIVTRRFVVTDGHGDIYIRIQNRNGITYSKNGLPVTEQSWINGTEDANLEKNY